MKKLLSVLIMLTALSAYATIGMDISMGLMYNNNTGSTTATLGSAWFIVASTSDAVFTAETTPVTAGVYTVGGTFGGADDYILAMGTINEFSGAGTAGNYFAGVPYTAPGLNAGDPFAMVWINGIAPVGNSVTATANTWYGVYTDPIGSDASPAQPWVVGADSSDTVYGSYTPALDGNGYPATENVMYADLQVAPEPSTYAVIFGLAALAMAYIRRRK